MRRLIGFLALSACALFAQTVETIPFRAVLSSAKEVPPVGVNATGVGTVWVHVVRDASGQITSGSVDYQVSFTFPGAVTVTNMHIHSGGPTVSGPVVIPSGLNTSPLVSADGKGSARLQYQLSSTDTAELASLKAFLQDPGSFYLNMHTTDNPSGAIRGQLARADMTVLMGLMSPAKEVPPIAGSTASAVGSVVVLRTPDSGQVIFDANYSFPAAIGITGFHIHNGPAGVNASVVINSGLTGTVESDASGSGNLHYEAEVNMQSAAAVRTLNDLYVDPSRAYINIHTTASPGGAIRAQLRNTDRTTFQVDMLPSNEVPAITGLDASAPTEISVYTLRNPDGSIPAGVVIFDANARFPGSADIAAMHIHDGVAGANGGVTIGSGLAAFTAATGAANVFSVVTVSTPAGIATLNSLMKNPEKHYVNLHTKDHPGGAIRAQLAPANTSAPDVGFAMSSVSDPARVAVAPGGLMTIFGNNLTKVPAALTGFEGNDIPIDLDGTEVTIAGRMAPVLVVTPTYVIVQVPVETEVGKQPLVLSSVNGEAKAYSITVTDRAPNIYYDPQGAIVQKVPDFSLVRPGTNPAHAGDLLLIWSTGLGATTPALVTGRIVAYPPPSNTGAVTVMIGGKNADVLYSIASPELVGIYQTLVQMPAGVAPGNAALMLAVGDATSNTVPVAVE